MGLWTDIKKDTGYDREPSAEKRAQIRQLYFQKATEAGYDISTADDVLKESGVYADEERRADEAKQHAGLVAQAHDPAWKASMDAKVQAARDPLEVAEEAYRASLKGEPAPKPWKYRLPEKMLNDQELKDRYMAVTATGDPEKDSKLAQERQDSPFYAGLRRSVLGTAGISDLPDEQRQIVQQAINESSAKVEGDRRNMSFGDQVVSKAAEMAGGMAGSPSTYLAPLIPTAPLASLLPEAAPLVAKLGAGGVDFLLGSPGAVYGAASAAEGVKTEHNLGNEDANYAKEIAKGYVMGRLGGAAGKQLGAVAGDVGGKLGSGVGTAAELGGNAAGFGAVQTGAEIAGGITDKARGKDQRSYGDIFKDAGTGFAANMLMGLPQSVVAHRQIESQKAVARKEYDKADAIQDHTLAASINNITAKYTDPETIGRVTGDGQATLPGMDDTASVAAKAHAKLDGIDREAERRINNDLGFTKKIKNIALGVGEKLVDTKMRALSYLNSAARREQEVIVSECMSRGMSRGEALDAINKGYVEMPLGRRIAEQIKELPTEMQTMVHNANTTMAPAYHGMNAAEGKLLDRYVLARALLSNKRRVAERAERAAAEQAKHLKAAEEYQKMSDMSQDAARAEWIKKAAEEYDNASALEKKAKETYHLPMKESELAAIIMSVERSKNAPELAKRAEYIFNVSREIARLEYEQGIIPKDEYDRLMAVKDHVGIEFLTPASEYKGASDRKSQSASASDMFQLLQGGGNFGLNTDVAGIMHQRVVRAQMEAYKNNINKGFLEYAKRETPEDRNGFRIIDSPDNVMHGESFITVMEKGKKIFVAMPDWLKASLERDTAVTSEVINAVASLSMAGAVKKFAVQWNPEFAMANIPRDIGRYYRLMAEADSRDWSMKDLKALKNIVSANPVSYAADMAKNIAAVRLDASKKMIHDAANKGKPYDKLTPYAGEDWYGKAIHSGALRGVIARDTGNPSSTQSTAKRTYNSIDKALGMCGEFSENLLRVAAFKSLVDKGFTEKRAGQIVGQFLDYNRYGTVSKLADKIVPFFNVAVQAPRADIRIMSKNPAAYMTRVCYSAASFIAMAALAYSLDEGESEKQTPARTRSSSLRVPVASNKDGSFRMALVPLDQQDRLLAAICDSAVKMYYGKPADTARIRLAAKDFASVNPDMLLGIPAVNALNNLFNHANYDPYRDSPLDYAPAGFTKDETTGTWHESYKPGQNPISEKVAAAIYPFLDLKPASINYFIKTLFPSTFFAKVEGVAESAAKGEEITVSKVPMVSKLVKDTDPKLPLREAAKEGQLIKSQNDLKRYRDVSVENEVKDPDAYMDMMLRKMDEAPVSEKKQIVERLRAGYVDRIMGVDPETKFIKSQTDPSAWEELDKLHPFIENPRVLKKYMQYKAGKDADSQ